jgi:hypothetical protein
MAGVYMIKCRNNGMFYIGGTTYTFEERFGAHRSCMNQGKSAPRLQACFELYGPESLEFIPLKEFPPEEVAAREAEAIETLKPQLNTYKTDRPRRWPPRYLRTAKLYEVNGEMLSVPDLAKRYGIEEATIYTRAQRGLRGNALVAPKHRAPRKPYTRHK